MAAGDMRISLEGEFLWGTAGSTAATVSNRVDDVNLSLDPVLASAILRGELFETNKVLYLKASITFKLHDVEGDALQDAIVAAAMSKGRIALYPKTKSGKGLNGDFYVSFKRAEANSDFVGWDVTATPTSELRAPAYQ